MATHRPREALAAAERGTQTKFTKAWQAMALAESGDVDTALLRLEEAIAGGYRDGADRRSSPYYASLRRDSRFPLLLAKHVL